MNLSVFSIKTRYNDVIYCFSSYIMVSFLQLLRKKYLNGSTRNLSDDLDMPSHMYSTYTSHNKPTVWEFDSLTMNINLFLLLTTIILLNL